MDKFELRHNERLIPNDIGNELLSKYVLVTTKDNVVLVGLLIEKLGEEVLLYFATINNSWQKKDLTYVSTDINQFDSFGHIKREIYPVLDCIWLSGVKVIIWLSEEVSDYYESIINKEELKND